MARGNRPHQRVYRRVAIKHHRQKCVVCGSTYRKTLTVHHDDGDVWNNEPENLVWACRKCHDLIDVEQRPTAIARVKKYLSRFRDNMNTVNWSTR